MQVGSGIALTTGIETAGVGALAGGVLSLYGAGSAGVATADMTKVLKELYQLNISANGESDASRGNPEKVGSNARRMTEEKIGDFFGSRDWHKKLKTEFLKKI